MFEDVAVLAAQEGVFRTWENQIYFATALFS